MRYALTAAGIARIAAFLTPRTLLAFDIDGTLAPIVERLAAERTKADAETAATRVDFFTLVRGEDEA